MKEGRELDALVAEKVMGWKRVVVPKDYDGLNAGVTLLPSTSTAMGWAPKGAYQLWHFCPCYSTDIAAAWLVVEKLAMEGDEHPACIQKGLPAFGDHATPFEVYKNYAGYPGWTCYFADYEVCAHADTAPLAICLAALKAVGVEVEE